MSTAAVRAYYATPGPLTDLTAHAARIRELPADLHDLCRVVQGSIVHPFLAQLRAPRTILSFNLDGTEVDLGPGVAN